MTVLLEAAIKYASRGWHVLPLHWPVNGHCSCRDKECQKSGKHPVVKWSDATTDPDKIKSFWSKWPQANIGILTGEKSNLVVLDIDPRHDGDESLFEIEQEYGPLPKTPESLTGGGGFHKVFEYPGCFVKSTTKILGKSGIDIRGDDGLFVAPPSLHVSGKEYVWEVSCHPDDVALALLPEWLRKKQNETEKQNSDGWISEAFKNLSNGNRNDTFCKIAGRLNRDGYSSDDIISLLMPKAIEIDFSKEELEKEVEGICKRYPSAKTLDNDPPFNPIDQWPKLNDVAYLGLVGDIVKAIEPHTEADPIAILLNLLTSFGNLIGDGPHFLIEHTKHPLREFVVQVGKSSIGRKGQAWSTPKHIFNQIDSEWLNAHVTGGLSSGEGLIYAVRDEQTKFKDGVEEVADPGISDKRLLLIEAEFSQALKVMKREGNILSSIVRHAWDDGNLRTLTKTNPTKATGAHISIVAHTTQEELLRLFDDLDMANGFGNRFLWALIKRSKKIALPKGMDLSALNTLIAQLSSSIAFGKTLGKIEMASETIPFWEEIYGALTEDRPGLLGALLNRAATHVLRLSCIYTASSKASKIQVNHLKAATALWQYCEDSTNLIFKDATGNPVADRIYATLKNSSGKTKTEIDELFGRHGYRRIQLALEGLLKNGLVEFHNEKTGGRSRQLWRATQKA